MNKNNPKSLDAALTTINNPNTTCQDPHIASRALQIPDPEAQVLHCTSLQALINSENTLYHLATLYTILYTSTWQVERVLDPPLDEMVAAHLRGCWAWAESDFMEAYRYWLYTVYSLQCTLPYPPGARSW